MNEMAKHVGLTKRKGSSNWYFRKRCPKGLLRPGVPEQVWISLETSVYKEAVEKLDEARLRARDSFSAMVSDLARTGIYPRSERLRRPDTLNRPQLTVGQVLPLVRAFFVNAHRDMDLAPSSARDFDDAEQANDYRRELSDRIAELSDCSEIDQGEGLTTGAEAAILIEAGLSASPDGAAGARLRQYVRRAMVQLVAIRRARFDGDHSDRITDSLFAGLQDVAISAPNPVTVVTVGQAGKDFLVYLNRTKRELKSQDRNRRTLDHIIAFFGPHSAIAAIKRTDCDRLNDIFARLPPNFQRLLTPDQSYEALAVKSDGTNILKYNTLSTYLGMLTRFMQWAEEYDVIEKSYARRIAPLAAKPDGSMAKFPFDDAELGRIFSRPIYTGCKNDGIGFAKPGPNVIRKSRYWAPLIGLFGGLRSGEILQLTPQNFRRSDKGTPYILLTKSMQDIAMELKNDNAEREIPVHPMLQAIGLLEWVERRRLKPAQLLFPEVTPDTYHKASCNFSKRFASDLRHFELGERRKKLTFHSFRHCFKRGLDRASVGTDEKDELCGWSRGKKMGRRYGSGLEADVLKPCVEAIQYDLNLGHLFKHRRFKD